MGVSTVTLSSKTGRPLMILGNHDLEGAEFVSDSDNLQCWKESFEQDHYWLEEHGDWLLIGLSTVRFRSNANSCHEVFVDKEQRDWLESTLDRYKTLQQRDGRKRRAVIFSHAPPAGSGLKVVHNVHGKSQNFPQILFFFLISLRHFHWCVSKKEICLFSTLQF